MLKKDPKIRVHKRKEHEATDYDCESMEFLDKAKENKVTSDRSTSKELSLNTKKSTGFEIELHGYFNKIKPPTFDDESEK